MKIHSADFLSEAQRRDLGEALSEFSNTDFSAAEVRRNGWSVRVGRTVSDEETIDANIRVYWMGTACDEFIQIVDLPVRLSPSSARESFEGKTNRLGQVSFSGIPREEYAIEHALEPIATPALSLLERVEAIRKEIAQGADAVVRGIRGKIGTMAACLAEGLGDPLPERGGAVRGGLGARREGRAEDGERDATSRMGKTLAEGRILCFPLPEGGELEVFRVNVGDEPERWALQARRRPNGECVRFRVRIEGGGCRLDAGSSADEKGNKMLPVTGEWLEALGRAVESGDGVRVVVEWS